MFDALWRACSILPFLTVIAAVGLKGQDDGGVLVLKEELGKSEELTFGSLLDLVPHPAGGFLILDGIDQNVRWWHPTEGLRFTVGGPGDGPGEFRRVVSLAVQGDHFVVVDAARVRATAYSWDGTLVSDWALPFPTGTPPMWSYPLGQDRGVVYATAPRTSPIPSLVDLSIHLVVSRPPLPADTVASINSGIARWREPSEDRLYGLRSGHFGVGGAWAGAGDSELLVVDCYDGRLTSFEIGANTIRSASVSVPRLRGRQTSSEDEAEVARFLRNAFQAAGRVLPRGITFETPAMVSSCKEAIPADENELWVRLNRGTDVDGPTYAVLRAGEGWVRDASFPSAFRLKAIVDGHYIGFAESAIGEPLIRVYGPR